MNTITGEEMLDASDPDFKEKLDFALWSTGGSSDYRNDRERPYNGQPHTDEGIRGKQEVYGVTMRDVRDCLIKAFLACATSERYLNKDFLKCWDFSSGEPKPTQFLLDHQDEPEFVSCKDELGTWRPQDVYKINFDHVDPIAVCQNLTCNIERMMGIYPNINTQTPSK